MKMKALSNYLQEELVKTIIQEKTQQKAPLIQLTTKTTFKEALSLLAQNNVLSMPVTEAGEVKYVAWFGVMEALFFILRAYAEDTTKEAVWTSSCDIDTLVHKGEDLGKKTIEEILDQVPSQKWLNPVNPMGSVFELVELFSTSGIHRIGVMNNGDDNYVRNIITQSDIIQLISKKIFNDSKSLGPEIHTHIGSIPDLKKRVKLESPISMSLSATTIHAFWLMGFHKVYGIAVIDSNERLVANISASDVKVCSRILPG